MSGLNFHRQASALLFEICWRITAHINQRLMTTNTPSCRCSLLTTSGFLFSFASVYYVGDSAQPWYFLPPDVSLINSRYPLFELRVGKRKVCSISVSLIGEMQTRKEEDNGET